MVHVQAFYMCIVVIVTVFSGIPQASDGIVQARYYTLTHPNRCLSCVRTPAIMVLMLVRSMAISFTP